MPIGNMRKPLQSEVTSRKHATEFERGRQRHPVLLEYPTVSAILGLFKKEVPDLLPRKEALVRVLLIEHQRGGSSFWSSLLTLMYLPMLISLERRIKPGPLAVDEVEQIVFAKFLEIISVYKVHAHADAHTFVRVSQRTAKRIYRHIKREREYTSHELAYDPHVLSCLLDIEDYDSDQAIWPHHKKERWADTPAEQAAKTALLMEHGADVLPLERLRLVLKTYVGKESLREYLRRRNSDLSDADFGRLYQRVKRQHSRDVRRLRDALRHLRHPREDANASPAISEEDHGDEERSCAAG